MSAIAFQPTGVSIVCSTISSSADQRKYQSSASLASVRATHWWPMADGVITKSNIFPEIAISCLSISIISPDMEIHYSTMSALNKLHDSFKQGPSHQVTIVAILPFHRHCWAYLSYTKKMLINQTNINHILSSHKREQYTFWWPIGQAIVFFIQGSPLWTDDRNHKFKSTFMFSQTLLCVRCLNEIKIEWWWYPKRAMNSWVSNKAGNCAFIRHS